MAEQKLPTVLHKVSAYELWYFKLLSEDCIGLDESKRAVALKTLASDSAVRTVLHRLCIFIFEGVRVNICRKDLRYLIYLMRMVSALLKNDSLSLECYLHQILPSIISCIVCKTLCKRPELDNHWALRDFGAQLMAQICRKFNTTLNDIQIRFTRLLTNKFVEGDSVPLSTLYGILAGLSALGGEAVHVFILPKMQMIGSRIEVHLKGTITSNADKIASGRIKQLVVQVIAPLLKSIGRMPRGNVEVYTRNYGYFGPALHSAIWNARTQSKPSTFSSSSTISRPVLGTVQQNIAIAGNAQAAIFKAPKQHSRPQQKNHQ